MERGEAHTVAAGRLARGAFKVRCWARPSWAGSLLVSLGLVSAASLAQETAQPQGAGPVPAVGAAGAPAEAAQSNASAQRATATAANSGNVLRVCADPHNLPQSNDRGEGYENKIAQALARDLGRKVEYTFFPQRMGFVRNTLRARDETTMQFKCDVIIGVPKGYELTATTQPYMHSTYALLLDGRDDLKGLRDADDMLKLSPQKLHALRIGLFAKTPASDWVLKNGLMDHAVFYPAQSGDPNESPETIIERDLSAGNIDVAILWGPVAGFLANRHDGSHGKAWQVVPFKPTPAIKFDYEMAMGVRQGEKDWKDTLDSWIASHRAEIGQILTSYHIPLVEGPATPNS